MRIAVLPASLVAMALVLAACGGSNDDDAARATTSTTVDDEAGDHGSHDGVPSAVAKPLATRADGIIDADLIDLGGIEGVTAEQQARAEDLLRRTVEILPRWADAATAEADGFVSIGDGGTGEEHLLRWDWIDDDTMLDPNFPEALVYRVAPDGTRTLDAAMFVLPDRYNFDNLPDLGGALTQFHIHDNLCFTQDVAPKVVALTNADGTCNPPLVKVRPNPMIHVWIRQNPCGPFAALQGIGAGTVAPGEEQACDPDHGRLTL